MAMPVLPTLVAPYIPTSIATFNVPANDDVKCGAVGAVFSVRSEAVSRSVIFGGGLGWWGVLGGS
jgi:hypothetical protein